MTLVLGLVKSWFEATERVLASAPSWAARLEPGSWPLETVVALAGLALLLGGLRLERVVSALGGAALGALVGGLVAPRLGDASRTWPLLLGACALGVGGALLPVLYPIVLGGLGGILLGAALPIEGRAWLGSVALGAAGVALALLGRRAVLAATSAVAGAILVATAALAFSGRVGLVAELGRRPLVLGSVAAVLAVAGAAFQLGRGAGEKASSPRSDRPAPPRAA